MWKGERQGPDYEAFLAQINSPEKLSGELGFSPVLTDEGMEEEGILEFARPFDIPAGPGELIMSFSNIATTQDQTPAQDIRLGVRIPGTDFANTDIIPIDIFLGDVTQKAGEHLPVSTHIEEGYGKIFQILADSYAEYEQAMQQMLTYPDQKKEFMYKLVEQGNIIYGLQSYLEKLYRDKATKEEEYAQLLENVIKIFARNFPDYKNQAQVTKENNAVYLYGEKDGDKIPAIRITPAGNGFEASIGNVTDITTSKKTGSVTVKGKSGLFTLSPINKNYDDWQYRSWEFDDAGEAVYYASMVKNGLAINEQVLKQPATWSDELNRSLNLDEELAYQKYKTGDDMKFPLPDSPVTYARRSYSLPEDQLLKLTIERLNYLSREQLTIHTGETIPLKQAIEEVSTGTELGKKIMRFQVVQLESQISLLQTGRYSIEEPDRK